MLISFGELLVDMIRRKAEDTFQFFPGGAPANFSVGVARLGIKPTLIASVGKDFFGDMLMKLIEKENINMSSIKRSEEKTTISLVELQNTIPEFVLYRHADLDLFEYDIDERIFEHAKWFHFGSLSLTNRSIRDALFKCLRIAKGKNLTISFSPNIRTNIWNKSYDIYLKNAIGYTDVLISSEWEFEYIFGSADIEDVVKNHDLKKIVITKGEKGSILYSNNKKIEQDIFPVTTVDTTGAGDAFAAGFVFSMLRGKADREALKFASAVAALSTTKKGAISALPTIKEVETFVNDH